jgi:FkbM family methyltransferase
MLIPFNTICKKYGFIPKGILHIGAHEMEERADYLSLGVNKIIWVDGNPDLVEKCRPNIDESHERMLHALVYSEDDLEFDFKITNNSQSSSILEFSKHKEYHPQVEFVRSINMKSKRVDSLLREELVSPSDFDFVNLDIQGVELQALRGFGDYLEGVKYVYTEINTGEVYKDNDSLEDLDFFLYQKGFDRVETYITPYEWGDAFYIKKQ